MFITFYDETPSNNKNVFLFVNKWCQTGGGHGEVDEALKVEQKSKLWTWIYPGATIIVEYRRIQILVRNLPCKIVGYRALFKLVRLWATLLFMFLPY